MRCGKTLLAFGLPGQLQNEMVLFDLLTLDQRRLKIHRRNDCRHDASVAIETAPPDLEVRMINAEKEMQKASEFDVQIVNDDFERSFAEFKKIVENWRA